MKALLDPTTKDLPTNLPDLNLDIKDHQTNLETNPLQDPPPTSKETNLESRDHLLNSKETSLESKTLPPT